MQDDEVIARQARQIETLKAANRDMQSAIAAAKSHIICIGGPLNDNRLGFSKPQMAVFQRILWALEGTRSDDT